MEGTSRKQAVTLNDRIKQVAGTLIIKEAKVEDSGKYLCVVNNSVGGESVETVLTVTAPLKASIDPQVQTIDFGRPAVFTCNFEGNPIKTISWLKDGKPLEHSEAVFRIEAVRSVIAHHLHSWLMLRLTEKKTRACTSASSATTKRVPRPSPS